LAAIVASRSTVSRVDCYGVIIGLTQAISESLAAGRIVKIDDLGTFQITLQGLPADSPADLGKSNIKGAKIIYKPSRDMKSTLKQLTYKRIRQKGSYSNEKPLCKRYDLTTNLRTDSSQTITREE
jgi:predicted histone-like DNA-binding protein